jgi:4-alpha-glucanotransferase
MIVQPTLRERASKAGIAPEYTDARGQIVEVKDEVLRKLLKSIGEIKSDLELLAERWLPVCLVLRPTAGQTEVPLPNAEEGKPISWRLSLEDGTVRTGNATISGKLTTDDTPKLALDNVPFGYHRLEVDGFEGSSSLIVTPGQCCLPDHFADDEKSWGVSLQLYLLRSQHNWGIGDFSDLAALAEQLGSMDCDVLGLNPLHQMFLDEPEQASPYSPTDRQFLNVLNIDVIAIPELAQSAAAQALVQTPAFLRRLEQCRAARQVDYAMACSLKLEALLLTYQSFLSEATAQRRADCEAFIADAGEPLRRSSIFQALRSHFHGQNGHAAGSETWPEEFRSPTSSAVAEFARTHETEIGFLEWLQWIADQQLKAASDRAAAAGMRIGLYRDLAVGCDRSGGELWSDPDAFLKGVLVGAPPDILNPAGQNWGLPPFNPASLVERAFAPFINLVRANMRYAGGLRIDHVMGLQRLYCIPEGCSPLDGAYVNYPIDDLIGILALESHRHRCLVVGEDLGTVPEGFRERMADANILSYRVTFFEQREDGCYVPADQYPELSVSVAGSHDLPTLKNWLEGDDIDLRASLGLYPSENETQTQRDFRASQKSAIFDRLKLDTSSEIKAFTDAVHGFLGKTSSMLAMAQLDDLVGEADPVNVPGTSTEHANWRRKYAVELEQIARHAGLCAALDPLKAQRRKAIIQTGPAQRSAAS